MTTRLWEDTIILAMRDMQWIHALTNGKPWPSLSMWKLDGRPEESLADLVVAEDQRFFLIEVKSSSGQFASEWMRRDPLTRTVTIRPKRSYANLAYLLGGHHRWFPWGAAQRWVDVSSTCHFFAYGEVGNNSSDILVRGYADACAENIYNPNDRIGMHPVVPVPRLAVMGEAGIKENSPVSFPDVLSERCVATYKHGKKARLYKVGARLDVFRDYIYLLTQGGTENSQMNAIVLAPGGRFVRVVRSIRDLAIVLGSYRPAWAQDLDNQGAIYSARRLRGQ